VSYLSDADCLLAGSPMASYNTENMAQLIAASVAARGVLFGNAHVAAPRYMTNTVLYDS
jgi:cell cycle checkpoint protein